MSDFALASFLAFAFLAMYLMPRDPRKNPRARAQALMDAFAKVFQLSSEAIRYYDYNKAYQSLLDARALQPLYDALNDVLGMEQVKRYIEREIIEIIPLAYMRGRTLNNAFIILDEGQNTTASQMKMFLTRLGIGSKVVANGDVTQFDLPEEQLSGLVHAAPLMKDIHGIAWVELEKMDIVRHPLVKKIVEAYGAAENNSTPKGQ